MKKIITSSAKALFLFAFAFTSATNMMADDATITNPYLKGDKVPYADKYGNVQYIDKSDVTILTGEETELTSGWYAINKDLEFTHSVKINGTVNLISQRLYYIDGKEIEGPSLEFNNYTTDDFYCIYSENSTDSLCLYVHEANTDNLDDRKEKFDLELCTDMNKEAMSIAHLINYGQYVNSRIQYDEQSYMYTLTAKSITNYHGFLLQGYYTGIITDDLNLLGGGIVFSGTEKVNTSITVNSKMNVLNSDVSNSVILSTADFRIDGDFSQLTSAPKTKVISYLFDRIDCIVNLDDIWKLSSDISSSDQVKIVKTNNINDTEDNSNLITSNTNETQLYYLENRTITAGYYNTFSSPLFLNKDNLNEIFGYYNYTFKQLTNATLIDDQLSLEFETVTLDEYDDFIFANTPYLLKVNNSVVNPTLIGEAYGDNIVKQLGIESPETSFNGVSFVATSAKPHTVEGDKESMLFLGANNTLYYPNAMPATINGFRAYFTLDETVANAAKRISLNIDGEPTSISEVSGDLLDFFDAAGEWYTVQGVKLNGKPSTPGMFIHNGVKVTIK
ncbi:MAG: hypothetical protein K6E54_09575 [Bacteroidaceae bacterium]|nr:hypothetical protein [Bacteroidaceae bacterium]